MAIHASVGMTISASAATTTGKPESLDDLYEKAKNEGSVVVYAPISPSAAKVVVPAFEKRFPGIQVNHVDATSDKLVARAISEARGGKVFGDVFSGTMAYISRMREQNLLLDIVLPEATSYPPSLKGTYWVATDTEFFIAAWNRSRVAKGDEPNDFEDLANPKWKNRLMAEPRDFELLMGLAKYKYRSDDRAIEVLKKIAANQVEFHKGHSQLAELLVAGQADVCVTCYAHHIPPRVKKGAPLEIMLKEGIGRIGGTVTVFKNSPHPNAGLLWARWLISQEGQTIFAQAGETPAHPKVEPVEKIRPATTYMVTVEDTKEFPKYQKLWNQIFNLR